MLMSNNCDKEIREARKRKQLQIQNVSLVTATSCMVSNRSCTARGITPGSVADPRIVCVFPLLV